MRTVTVRLNGNNQIAVTVGDESRTGECYYLGLHPNSIGSDFNPRRGVELLLGQWLRLLTDLRDEEQLFLPFDFSDEFTRWLTVRRSGCDATIVIGWSTIEGWAISLEDFSDLAHGLPGFIPDDPLTPQTFYLPRVLSDLRSCVMNLHCRSEST